MKAKLRGHHLICLNFFKGEVYSEDFIRNIYSVIEKESIEIVKGPDDVCARCPYLKDSTCNNPDYSDDMIQFQDMEALKLLGFKLGMEVDWKMISNKLPGIIGVWKAQFCGGCGYRKVCFG